MSSVVIQGDSSGSVTLQAPAAAGSVTVTLPASSGTMAVTGAPQSFTDITATGNLTVNGNTTLGDASTDTILMTGAPSIGGAGLGMGMGFRNRIINGAMVIDQRNAGASVATPSGANLVDRYFFNTSQTGKVTAQQNQGSVTPPSGFSNYLGFTSSSAYSVLTGDYLGIQQRIEGFNVADLAWGSASAATVTLSFWVRSSLTGTFGGSLTNSAGNRSYPFSYSISSANTWEQKTITIAGDTSGTWLTTNGIGIGVTWSIGTGTTYSGTAGSWSGSLYLSATGATSVVGTNGATFYITGVQLEKGSTATSFDYRPYGTELALCQRYLPTFNTSDTAAGFGTSSTGGYFAIPYQVPSRTAATGVTVLNATSFRAYSTIGNSINATAMGFIAGGVGSAFVSITTAGSLTAGQGTLLYSSGGTLLFTGCEL